MTVILVSHSMEDVAKYVNRLIVMNQGQVVLDGIPKEVFSYSKELEAIGLAVPQVTRLMIPREENTAIRNSIVPASLTRGSSLCNTESAG